MAEKAYQHGAHTEVDVAGAPETLHAGIYHGHSGLPVFPGGQIGGHGIIVAIREVPIGAIDRAKLHLTLGFELLHKVTVPVKTRR